MVENIKVSTKTIRNMDKAFSLGLMENTMMEDGKMVNNTVKQLLKMYLEKSVKDCGPMVKGHSG